MQTNKKRMTGIVAGWMCLAGLAMASQTEFKNDYLPYLDNWTTYDLDFVKYDSTGLTCEGGFCQNPLFHELTQFFDRPTTVDEKTLTLYYKISGDSGDAGKDVKVIIEHNDTGYIFTLQAPENIQLSFQPGQNYARLCQEDTDLYQKCMALHDPDTGSQIAPLHGKI